MDYPHLCLLSGRFHLPKLQLIANFLWPQINSAWQPYKHYMIKIDSVILASLWAVKSSPSFADGADNRSKKNYFWQKMCDQLPRKEQYLVRCSLDVEVLPWDTALEGNQTVRGPGSSQSSHSQKSTPQGTSRYQFCWRLRCSWIIRSQSTRTLKNPVRQSASNTITFPRNVSSSQLALSMWWQDCQIWLSIFRCLHGPH